MNHYLRFRNVSLGATAWCLVLFIIAQTASAQQTIILDNFDDDVGELAGETTTSGHPWLVSSKNEVQNRTLTTGAAFGQSGTVGAGDAQSGPDAFWRGNMVMLGQQLGNTPGTYLLSADLLKDHQAGINHEMNVILRSSTQAAGGRETVINYKNDRLSTGGNWFHGLNEGVAFGTPASIHVDLTLELVPGGGMNSGSLTWFEIGNESNTGTFPLPNPPTGTLLYDELHLLTNTKESKTVGFDNISLSLVSDPTPPDGSWVSFGSGDWNVTTNWNGASIPNSADAPAKFTNSITAPSVVFTTQDVTVNSLLFDNSNNHSYVIAGQGIVNLSESSGNDLPSIVNNQGSHELQARVRLNANTDVNVASGSSLEFNHRLDLGGNTLTKTGTGILAINSNLVSGGGTVICQEGTCSGSGTVSGDLNNSGGTISPGNSPGVLTVDGDYTQGAGGTLAIELAGTSPGDEYDRLVVNGQANLEGTLAVTLLDSFTPLDGHTFDILDFNSVSGDFDSLNLPGGFDWNWDVNTGVLSVGSVVGGLAGDFDGNGVVDAADYTIYMDNLGGDSAVLGGNGSGGSTVGQADYLVWKSSFGNTSGSGSSAAIPEPSVVSLLLLAIVTCSLRRGLITNF